MELSRKHAAITAQGQHPNNSGDNPTQTQEHQAGFPVTWAGIPVIPVEGLSGVSIVLDQWSKPFRSMTRKELEKFYLQIWPEALRQEPVKDQALSDRQADFDRRWEREFGPTTHTRRA